MAQAVSLPPAALNEVVRNLGALALGEDVTGSEGRVPDVVGDDVGRDIFAGVGARGGVGECVSCVCGIRLTPTVGLGSRRAPLTHDPTHDDTTLYMCACFSTT